MAEQWVNVSRDQKWVTGPITSIENAGPVRFKVTLIRGVGSQFKYRLVEDGGNIAYTADEKKRNAGFKAGKARGSEVIVGTQALEYDITLPAAGGNKYKVEYQYKGETKTSGDYEARRILFYQSIKMVGVTPGDLPQLEADFWATGSYYIKLVREGGDATVPLLKNMPEDKTGFYASVKTAYAIQNRKPFGFALVWCHYLAKKAAKTVNQTFNAVTLPGLVAQPAWAGLSRVVAVGKYLWHGLADDEDAAQHWLEGVTCTFKRADGVETNIPVPSARVTLEGAAKYTFGGYNRVKIQLTGADLQPARQQDADVQGALIFQVKFRTVGSWTNGFSAGGGMNVIVVAEKTRWGVRAAGDKAQTVIHELGHKIGMVSDAIGKKPDKPATFYTGQNHQGRHCGKGAVYTAPVPPTTEGTWAGDPGCVMFGSSHAARPRTFCDQCSPLVRKLDLSPTMEGFQKSVGD